MSRTESIGCPRHPPNARVVRKLPEKNGNVVLLPFRAPPEKLEADMSSYSHGPNGLTPSELRVLSLAAEGYRPCDIADHMSTNVYRVKDHIYQVIVKLGVRNLDDAVVLYCRRSAGRSNGAGVEAVH